MFDWFWRNPGRALAENVVGGGLLAAQRSLMYFPDGTRPSPTDAGVPELTPVSLETEDGLALLAWHVPPRTVGMPTLIYFHGNAGHIGMRGFKVRAFLNEGLGVLLTTWRGYSGNPGNPSEEGLYSDGRAAREFVRAHGGDDANQILYGESLGTGVAVHLACEAAPAAVVLEAPYSSIADVAADRMPFVPVKQLILDRFDSAEKIAAIGAPLLVVHGERDETIPIKFARALFQRASEPKEAEFIPEAGHADLHDFGLAAIVLDFLARQAVGTR
jgi:fermentation-respiration switch protein FrsA (DUF1100 family)